MSPPIWPLSRFNTDLDLQVVDDFRVVKALRTNQPPRFVSYLVAICLLGLLAAAVYFKSIDDPSLSLALAGAFVGIIILLLLVDRLLTRCTQCGGRLANHSTLVPLGEESYRVWGHVCRSCKLLEIHQCINTKLESDAS